MKQALLLSGGMDSFAIAYWLRPEIVVTIDYGQRPAKREIEVSSLLAKRLDIRHEILRVDLGPLGSGDLSERPAIAEAPASDWWPYRNQGLITLAAMACIRYQTKELLIGTVNSDANHKDGAPGFIARMNDLLQFQEGEMTLRAPAIEMSTTELVKQSGIPYSLLAWSHSCHVADLACGRCRGCNKRREVAEDLGYAET